MVLLLATAASDGVGGGRRTLTGDPLRRRTNRLDDVDEEDLSAMVATQQHARGVSINQQ